MSKKSRRLTDDFIHEMDDGSYFIDCAMCSAFPFAFDEYESNADIAAFLIKQNVIPPDAEEDSETCSLVVNFPNWSSWKTFKKRFNELLDKIEKTKQESKYTFCPFCGR